VSRISQKLGHSRQALSIPAAAVTRLPLANAISNAKADRKSDQ
jgi:hypothetical protein